MAQYLDKAGLQELVTKTKEYARKSAKEAIVKNGQATSGYGPGRTITGWDLEASAAIYGDINITSAHVTDLADAMALKANLASPDFTGVPTAPTAPAGTNTTQIATTEFVTTAIGNIGEAMHYIGAINSESDLRTSGEAGDTYKVATAGTYLGYKCEVGDMIIANKDYSSALTSADVDVIQTNIDGAVTGPATAVSGNLAMFDNSNGKVIADAGLKLSDLKTKQRVYTASSGTLATLTAIEQNANGEISATFQDIQSATTSQKGVVELAGSIAATVDSENNKAATEKAVRDAINALDVTKVTVGADKTLVSIEEVDGKIQTEAVAIQIAESQVTNLVTDLGNIATSAANLDSKIEAVSGAVATSAAALDAKINEVSGAVAGLDAEVTSTDGKNVQVKVTETDGLITAVNITTDNTVTSGDVENAINALNFGPYAVPTSGTITSIQETNGVISVSSAAIAITSAQVTNLGQTLNDLIDGLDVAATAIPTSGTITSISEENGKISVSSGAISISVSQVNDLSAITNEEIDELF